MSAPIAIRTQRLALLAGLLIALWLALELFSAILLPFVVAAGLAYFLDPPTSQMQRAGLPRTLGALLMLIATLLFALLL